jgi:hypothetical protein
MFSMTLRTLRVATLLLAAGLTSCASDQKDLFSSNPNPTNYRADILSFLRSYLNDPTNVRDASVTQPILRRMNGFDRYVVCLRFNARKSDHSYAGIVDTAAVFGGGRLDRFIDLTPDETASDAALRKELGEVCKAAAFQPFPELERLTR